MAYAPTGRSVETPQGSARYRPTLFGLGFDVSLLPLSSFIVPRLGAGYAFLWVHVWPESAKAPAVQRKSEDLLAPVLYLTAAASFAVTPRFRIVGEALGGVSSHEAVVRIAGTSAAKWGGALSSLAVRGEWVFP